MSFLLKIHTRKLVLLFVKYLLHLNYLLCIRVNKFKGRTIHKIKFDAPCSEVMWKKYLSSTHPLKNKKFLCEEQRSHQQWYFLQSWKEDGALQSSAKSPTSTSSATSASPYWAFFGCKECKEDRVWEKVTGALKAVSSQAPEVQKTLTAQWQDPCHWLHVSPVSGFRKHPSLAPWLISKTSDFEWSRFYIRSKNPVINSVSLSICRP